MQAMDDVESEHLAQARGWLHGTTDVTRRIKPDVPSPHLVSYIVPVDRQAGAVFLCAHRLAGLWLPPGGHVEAGEHPAAAAAREAVEELGQPVTPSSDPWRPLFLTWTRTRGAGQHIDVSLWFQADEQVDARYDADDREFSDARWWAFDELLDADPAAFDPHLGRFVTKVVGDHR